VQPEEIGVVERGEERARLGGRNITGVPAGDGDIHPAAEDHRAVAADFDRVSRAIAVARRARQADAQR
jgi:hypothetical protein